MGQLLCKTSQGPWVSSSAKPCREEAAFETLKREIASHLSRNGVPWEHLDGCFPTDISSCRKANLSRSVWPRA